MKYYTDILKEISHSVIFSFYDHGATHIVCLIFH